MERTTRAQQRANAIDVSPVKLAAEIERVIRERDLARRPVCLLYTTPSPPDTR
jgi:hypothetical protein